MNDLQQALSQTINPTVCIPFSSFIQGKKTVYYIVISEEENTDKIGSLEKVRLIGFDEIYFAAKLDDNRYRFLAGSQSLDYNDSLLVAENIRKSCDAIIWGKLHGSYIRLLIELKSRNNENVPEKIKSTEAFIDYINSFLNKYYNIDNEYFTTVSLLINQNPDKGKQFQKFSVQGVEFHHFGGKSKELDIYLNHLKVV